MDRRAGWLGAAVLVAAVGVYIAASTSPSPPSASTAPSVAPGSMLPVPDLLVADPVPWQEVDWREIVRPPGIAQDVRTELRGVVKGGPGLVAFGRGRNPNANPDGLGDTTWIWASVDAGAWHGAALTAGFGPASVSEVHRLAAGPRGLIASGGVCCAEERPAIWWSADGTTWHRSDFLDGNVLAVESGPDGFVAVGGRDERAAIWVSEDGLRWAEVDPAAAMLGPGVVADVQAIPGGFVAAGSADPGANADGALWTARGLREWHRVAEDPALTSPDEEAVGRIVPFAGGWFAVGGRGTQAERKQCEALLGGGAAALTAGGGETALSCGWLRDMTWRAPAGGAWQAVDPLGPDGQPPPERVGPANAAIISWRFVEAGGPGLVLLDYEHLGRDDTGSILGLWTSTDGRTWSRVGLRPHIGPNDSVNGVVVLDRTVVAVGGEWDGANPEEPAIWIGTVRP